MKEVQTLRAATKRLRSLRRQIDEVANVIDCWVDKEDE